MDCEDHSSIGPYLLAASRRLSEPCVLAQQTAHSSLSEDFLLVLPHIHTYHMLDEPDPMSDDLTGVAQRKKLRFLMRWLHQSTLPHMRKSHVHLPNLSENILTFRSWREGNRKYAPSTFCPHPR